MLTLWSSGLLSKWGFNDGDIPEHLADWLYDREQNFNAGMWHPVLIRLVREKLLPALHQKVEVMEIGTNHNPIRATAVDGRDVEGLWYDASTETDELLTPESVDVPFEEVLQVMKEERCA